MSETARDKSLCVQYLKWWWSSHKSDGEWWAKPKPDDTRIRDNERITRLGRAICERGFLLRVIGKLDPCDVHEAIQRVLDERKFGEK